MKTIIPCKIGGRQKIPAANRKTSNP